MGVSLIFIKLWAKELEVKEHGAASVVVARSVRIYNSRPMKLSQLSYAVLLKSLRVYSQSDLLPSSSALALRFQIPPLKIPRRHEAFYLGNR